MEWQNFSVSLAQGIDTKTDPKQVQADYLVVSNAVYNELNQLNPRAGFTALTATTYVGGTITSGLGLGSLGNALLEYDGTLTYSRTTDLTTWSVTGQKTAITATQAGIGSSSSPYFQSIDCAKASNGLELYVWIDRQILPGLTLAGVSNYSVYDPDRNMVVTSGALPFGNQCIRAECVGPFFFIITADGTNIKIYKQAIATPNFSTASPTTVAANAAIQIDTCVGDLDIYILANTVYGVLISNLSVISTAASTYGQAPASAIAYDFVKGNVWTVKGVAGSGANSAVVFDQNLTVLAGPTTISTGGFFTDATFGPMAASCSGGLCYAVGQKTIKAVIYFTLSVSGATITSTHTFLNSNGQVYSKPIIKADGYTYCLVAYMSASAWDTTTPPALALNPIQPTTFLIKFIAANGTTITPLVASRSLGLETGMSYTVVATAGPVYTQTFWPCAPLLTVDNVNYFFPNQVTTNTVIGKIFPNQLVPNATITRTAFQFGVTLRTTPLAKNSLTTGGYVSNYDTNIEDENNFHLFPELTYVSQGGGGTTVPNGVYGYSSVYSWIDSLGQIHRSAPSPEITVTVSGGPNTVTLSYEALFFTDKTNVQIELYRTQTNGSTLFYLYSLPELTNTTLFDSAPAPQTLQLYTNGEEVENIAPPPTSYITTFKNRTMLISSENPLVLWYSKQVIPGTPVEFSDLFTMNVDQTGGAMTALATIDDKLVIFKQTALFYITGTGPAPSGANNDFSYPQFIPSDSGVTEPDSVVSYPEGVFFKGLKGIYMLERSLNVSYIGAPVEAYNQYTITSSKVDVNLQIVRFTLSNATSLAYDYYVKKWSIDLNISAVASTQAGNVYYYLQSNGVVQQQTPGTYSDNGSVIPLSLTSGWLSFARIQGFQRVKNILLLGKLFSNCTVTASFAYDFNPTITQTTTIINSTGALDNWQWRVFLNRQKCEAIQLTITVTPTTPGQALALSNIGMEIGIKSGMNKLPAAVSTT